MKFEALGPKKKKKCRTTNPKSFGLEIKLVFRCARRRLSYDVYIELNFGSIISLNSCMDRGEQRGGRLFVKNISRFGN
jgi:hypothetical protein